MKHGLCRLSVTLVLAACLVPQVFGDAEVRLATAKLHLDARFILETVARQMNVVLRPDIPVPEILFESTTPLRRFQKAVARQWGFEPHIFTNAYVIATNEIYLMDDAAYYKRRHRTLDDSLAHEFAHYLQARYLNANFADPSLETDAIAVQEQFRTAYAGHLAYLSISPDPPQQSAED